MSEAKWKQKTFAKSIRSQVGKRNNEMELLSAIYESNDDDLIESLPRLPSVHGIKFGPAEAHIFGSVLSRRRNKEMTVDLHHCGFNDELSDILAQHLQGLQLRVSK